MTLPGGDQWRQWTSHLDDPLQKEMTSVVHDARTAAWSLSDNFLPEKAEAEKLDAQLQDELRMVVSDAKTAAHAVADNFVPENVRAYFALIQN